VNSVQSDDVDTSLQVKHAVVFLNLPATINLLYETLGLIVKNVMVYSLFSENGVIVRNLNYRPWQ
jgi:hypothetical protein